MIVINGFVSDKIKQDLLAGKTHPAARRHANLIIAGGNFGFSLPDGYTQLSYIESTGTQHIDTGVILQSEKHRIVADFIHTKEETGATFFGVQDGTSTATYSFSITTWLGGNNTTSYETGGTSGVIKESWEIGNRYLLDVTADNGTITRILNGDTKTGTYVRTLNHNRSIPIFGLNLMGAVSYKSSFRLFSMKMYDNDILVRDFIPCIAPNGKIGLYDKVNDVFYTNAGTGEFVAG